MSVLEPTQSVTRIRRRVGNMQEKIVWRHWRRRHHVRRSPRAVEVNFAREQPIEKTRPTDISAQKATLETSPSLKPHGPKSLRIGCNHHGPKSLKSSPRSCFSPKRLQPNGPKSLKSSPHPQGFQSLIVAFLGFILDPLPVRPLGVSVHAHLHDASAENCCNVVLLGNRFTVKGKRSGFS